MQVISVYVPNGRSLDSDHYPAKLEWLARLRSLLEETSAPDQPVAVCGDFNVAPEDRDVWDPTAFEGATHVSQAERDALSHIESWGLVDVFRRLYADDRAVHLVGLPGGHRSTGTGGCASTSSWSPRYWPMSPLRPDRPECPKRSRNRRIMPRSSSTSPTETRRGGNLDT